MEEADDEGDIDLAQALAGRGMPSVGWFSISVYASYQYECGLRRFEAGIHNIQPLTWPWSIARWILNMGRVCDSDLNPAAFWISRKFFIKVNTEWIEASYLVTLPKQALPFCPSPLWGKMAKLHLVSFCAEQGSEKISVKHNVRGEFTWDDFGRNLSC